MVLSRSTNSWPRMADVLVRRHSGPALVITVGLVLLAVTTVAAVSIGAAQLDFEAVWSVLLARLGLGTP